MSHTTTTTHTPGPWTAYNGHVGTERAGVNGPNGNQICRTRKYDDARLIAAAPALLDALRALCDEYEISAEQEAKQGDENGLKCIKQARAAIAAATGEDA